MNISGTNRLSLLLLFLFAYFVDRTRGAFSLQSHRRHVKTTDGHWIAAWASMPQLTEPANLPNPPFNTSGRVFSNTTLRQTIHVTATSSRIRLRLSNSFGPTDLPITAVTLAKPLRGSSADSGAGSPAIDTTTLKTLTFGGAPGFLVPNAALVVSDPVDMDVVAGTELTVSLYLASGQAGNDITSHPGSRTTSWMAFGNLVNSATLQNAPSVQNTAHWFFISTLDAWVPTKQSTVAIIGDSITDGRGSTTDANNRWPDLLFARLQSSRDPNLTALSFANQAAGGNRILADGLGPNVLSRFDRDVLAQPGVEFVIIFEGVNDIGVAAATVQAQQDIGDKVISAFKQIIDRSHAANLPIFGATITPFSAPGFNAAIQPYSSSIREQTRQRVNTFIRESGLFDAVVDFDAVVKDPAAPAQLKAEFNSGDFLHPSVAGYEAMAEAFPVEIFQ